MHDRWRETAAEMPQKQIGPAEQLLFACAAAQAGGRGRDAIEGSLSDSGLDWPVAVQRSLQHGMAPIVAWHLSGFWEDPRIPSEVGACFARILKANALRNRVLFRETARLAQALEEADIPCLLLKGMGLALTVYSDPALRSCADIDVLIRPEDLEAADRIARSCGFQREDSGTSPVFHHCEHVAYCEEDILTGVLAPEFDTRVSAETIARLGHRVPLEIHIGLFCLPSGALRRVDMAAFWERAQAVSLPDGVFMRVPSPEAMLVHLAAHAAGDLFRKLIFPVDIALLLRHYGVELDWQHVTDLAERYAVRHDLCRILTFVADHFGIQTERSEKEEAPLTPAAIFAAMHIDGTALVWQRWRRAQNAKERLLSLAQILFPAPATMRRFYGVRSPLRVGGYYLLRPFLLAARLARFGLSVRPVRGRH